MRKVELSFDNGFIDVTANNTASVHKAVGYLSTWAVGSERYQQVRIYGDVRGDLHAVYRNKDNDVTYTIFGQRQDDGDYSFHS